MKEKPNYSAGESPPTPFQKFQALAAALVKVPRAELKQKMKQEKRRKDRRAK
ncbi:MAG TPA: hypothetical protein VG734_00450 [Lacunisphaera sp.]|nr:hypothetical protein [Lacunisphaera sp.]